MYHKILSQTNYAASLYKWDFPSCQGGSADWTSDGQKRRDNSERLFIVKLKEDIRQ